MEVGALTIKREGWSVVMMMTVTVIAMVVIVMVVRVMVAHS